MTKKFEFEIEGITEILPHKFHGLEEEKKLKTETEEIQAEKHAYFNSNGNLAIPSVWIKGALINEFYDSAPQKERTRTQKQVSPRLMIVPAMLDLGTKKYDVDVRSVPAGGRHGGCRDFCVRPIIKLPWKVKGTLITTLDISDKDLRRKFENAGMNQGIGSNRINGYGRFKIVVFNNL
ncbi:hypothetical protein KKH23_09185 [Patescibacteria group bacterium]|nr:hypothetical protein [Patescibacteria group bacterium]